MNATAADFTERQRQVVAGIARGLTNARIAELLGVGPRTVKQHADALRMKLRVGHRRDIPAAYRAATGLDPFEAAS